MPSVKTSGITLSHGRCIVAALILGAACFPALVMAVPSSLGDLFEGGSFKQDGLTFSDFKPALKDTPDPSASEIFDLVLTGLFNNIPPEIPDASFISKDGGDRFSVRWTDGDGSWSDVSDPIVGKGAANASNIGLTILDGAGGAPDVNDPGFRLDGKEEWAVDAGYSNPDTNGDDVAGVQLSAFVYDVTKDTDMGPIISADLTQKSVIEAIGPDTFFTFPPDVAGGIVFQYILDSANTNDILGLNVTWEVGLNTFFDTFTSEELYDWSGLDERDTVRVLTFIAIGATSEGGFTLTSMEQRIDPPSSPAGVPEPATLALIWLGLAGIGYRRRQLTKA